MALGSVAAVMAYRHLQGLSGSGSVAKYDEEAAKLDALQAKGKSGAQQFTTGDRGSQKDTKYGTIDKVPYDVMMARWSQHTGKPMGSGAGSSYAQRGRDLQSMAKQYKSLTTKVSTLNPFTGSGGLGPLIAGGAGGAALINKSTGNPTMGGMWGNILGKKFSDKWWSKTGNKMKANRDAFFGQSW